MTKTLGQSVENRFYSETTVILLFIRIYIPHLVQEWLYMVVKSGNCPPMDVGLEWTKSRVDVRLCLNILTR